MAKSKLDEIRQTRSSTQKTMEDLLHYVIELAGVEGNRDVVQRELAYNLYGRIALRAVMKLAAGDLKKFFWKLSEDELKWIQLDVKSFQMCIDMIQERRTRAAAAKRQEELV